MWQQNHWNVAMARFVQSANRLAGAYLIVTIGRIECGRFRFMMPNQDHWDLTRKPIPRLRFQVRSNQNQPIHSRIDHRFNQTAFQTALPPVNSDHQFETCCLDLLLDAADHLVNKRVCDIKCQYANGIGASTHCTRGCAGTKSKFFN
jgi:hypothetical protein